MTANRLDFDAATRAGADARVGAGRVDPPVSVFLHAFYTDPVDDIIRRVLAIPGPVRFYASTDTEAKAAEIRAIAGEYLDPATVDVRVFENTGFDIAPFLVGFRAEILASDIILKVHAKRSHTISSVIGDSWREMLLGHLLESRSQVRAMTGALLSGAELGMIVPPDFWFVEPAKFDPKTVGHLDALLRRLDLDPDRYRKADFPVGSMFWARASALRPLLDIGLGWADFRTEGQPTGGTLAHAVERAFIAATIKAGLTWTRYDRSSGDSHSQVRHLDLLRAARRLAAEGRKDLRVRPLLVLLRKLGYPLY